MSTSPAKVDEFSGSRSWRFGEVSGVSNGAICRVNALHPSARPGVRWRGWKRGTSWGSRRNGLHDDRGQAGSCIAGFRGGGHRDRAGWVLGDCLAAAGRQARQGKPGTPRPHPTSVPDSQIPPCAEVAPPRSSPEKSRRPSENLALGPEFFSWVLKLLEEGRTIRPSKWVWRCTSLNRPDS